MKKFILFAAVAATALVSCNKNGSMKPVLANEVDTLSYEMGMAQSQDVTPYLAQQGLDSTYIEAFLEGVKEGVMSASDSTKLAHYVGVMYGIRAHLNMEGAESYLWADSTTRLNRHDFIAGLVNGVHNKSNMKLNGKPLSQEDAAKDLNERAEKIHSQRYEKYKKEQQQKYEAYAKQPGVTRLPNGVCYKVLSQSADTTKVKETNYVNFFFDFSLIDGTEIRNNYNGEPEISQAFGVVPGYPEALLNMTVGSEWEFVIPYEAAYELTGGGFEPGTVFKFKIKVVSVQ